MDQQTVNGGLGNGGVLPRGRRVVVEEPPEEPSDVGGPEVGDDERRGVLLDDEDIIAAVEMERGERRGKGRGRRAVVGLGVFLVLAVCFSVGVWLVVGQGATRKAKVPVNGSGASSKSGAENEEAMTQQAMQQLGVGGPAVTMSDGSVVRPIMMQPSNGPGSGANGAAGSGTAPSSMPVTEVPVPPPGNGDLSKTVNGNAASGASESPGSDERKDEKKEAGPRTGTSAGGRNSERSVSIIDPVKPPDGARSGSVAGAGNGKGEDVRERESGIALPSFGSMLPVKTLGVLYTLRSGGLVRFELTRDVKGKGWSMSRGTVLVGALRGSEFDRAFVSVVGFIDPASGGFVKVSGDLLGSDGGGGIRGKRKKMSGAWSRALSRLGDAGLSIAGSLAGSIGGRRPIVITDAYGSYTGRVTNELEGALTGRDRDSFVEVSAGSTGYVMITELPDSVQGVDALAKLPGITVKGLSDADEPRRATGISESELAELIQSGDPDKIRAAFPRMTPEMRRVAEAVINSERASR